MFHLLVGRAAAEITARVSGAHRRAEREAGAVVREEARHLGAKSGVRSREEEGRKIRFGTTKMLFLDINLFYK